MSGYFYLYWRSFSIALKIECSYAERKKLSEIIVLKENIKVKIVYSVFNKVFFEFAIVLVFALLVQNNFVGNTITGDGIGYYEYLPSTFIYKDIYRQNYSEDEKSAFEKRTDNYGFYINYDRHYVNRYPAGTAILQMPFFFGARFFAESGEASVNDGYQEEYHFAIFIAALFYLLLALIFMKKLLQQYYLKGTAIYLTQLLLLFSTSVTQYASSNAAFSHVYSLFAITAFLYFTRKYFNEKSLYSFLYASLFLGLVVIIRNINVLIILFVPFLAGSQNNLKEGFFFVFKKPAVLVGGLFIFGLIVFIQLFLWYAQTGHFLLYSYKGDGFNFLEPQFINILFSYRKGLFIYTPVLLLGIAGVVWLFFKKEFFRGFSWLCFFIILTYLLSSWEWWYYGRSYGLRAYIDFYAIFFIPFALLFYHVNRLQKTLILIPALLTIPLNLIQNYQYQSYIIHGTGMNKEKYWKVFLKTHDSYKGIFYKRTIDAEKLNLLYEDVINRIEVPAYKDTLIWTKSDSLNHFIHSTDIIQVLFKNNFSEKNYSRLLLSIKDNEENVLVYHRPYFIQFAEQDFNQYQTGLYNFILPDLSKKKGKLSVNFFVLAVEDGSKLEDFNVKFFDRK